MADKIEVVGAGYGRTGTMSLYVALNQLGYKTHHMKEVALNPGQPSAWLQATRDRAAGRPIDWQSLFGPGGFTAAVDWPTVAVYKDLLAANPKVKVILTLRDFDSWYDSALLTIWRIAEVGRTIKPPFFLANKFKGITDLFTMHDELFWQTNFGGRFTDREHVRQIYEAHLAEVRRVVPPGQLLEFHVKEGWGPLCAFLGKQVPEGPFPRVNDNDEFQQHIIRMEKLSQMLAMMRQSVNVVLSGLAAGLVGGLLAWGRMRRGAQ